MSFERPLPSERRLPADELIRVPYEVPAWWDKEIKWRSPQQRDSFGQRKNGAPTFRVRIAAVLTRTPWLTTKELMREFDASHKSISDALIKGMNKGLFVRRRQGREYEYSNTNCE